MDKITLSIELTTTLENANFSTVINLWEEYGNSHLDMSNDVDRQICDAVSHSYLRLGLYEKALIYIDAIINYMRSEPGKEERIQGNYASWDYYCGMKGIILYEKEKYLELYKLVSLYKKLGGAEEGQLIRLTYIESLYYQKYFKPNLYKFVYFLSILIPCMVFFRIGFINKFNTSIYYYIAFLLAGAILILYIYFGELLKKIVLKIFRLYVMVFY